MRIEISKLSAEGDRYEGDEPKELLDLEGDRFIEPSGPVHYDFLAQEASRQLVVRGGLRVRLELMCSRCAEFFSTTVEDSSFLRAYEVKAGTEVVDIGGDMREALLLKIPAYPVCSPECRGLCPQCGQNLNKGLCSCRAPEKPSPWDDLNQLNL